MGGAEHSREDFSEEAKCRLYPGQGGLPCRTAKSRGHCRNCAYADSNPAVVKGETGQAGWVVEGVRRQWVKASHEPLLVSLT